MRIEISQVKVVAYLENPDRQADHAVDLSSLRHLLPALIRRILDATQARIEGKRYKTQAAYLRSSVVTFGRFLQLRGICSLPIHLDECQALILDFYIWYLSTGHYKATLVTRTRSWDQTISGWLCMLGEEGVLPRGLMIPKTTLPRLVVANGTALWPRSIGDGPAVSTNSAPVGRTLYGQIFWTTDVDAIEEIEQVMRSRIESLSKYCDDYWHRTVKDFHVGLKLIRSKSEWIKARASTQLWGPDNDALDCLKCFRPGLATHPNVPGSEAATLAILGYILRTSNDVSCLSAKSLSCHPAFCSRFARKRAFSSQDLLYELSSLTKNQLELQTVMSMYLRFLGVLSPLDIAVACAILIQEHPTLNPESIISARLLNVKGKSFVLATDRAGGLRLSVDKPRAGCRKYATLSKRAARVIKHILKVTAPVRELLRRAGSKFWRHLFVGSGSGKLGHPEVSSRQLNGHTKYSLVRYYPELEELGLVQGTLDFAKIRNTMGLLTWFETGSLVLVSVRLGNTYRVSLENYIPREIRRIWNEQIVRRFQNILLVLASAGKEYCLRVSDMAAVQELNWFLAQITYDFAPGSSVVADEIYRKYAPRFRISIDEQCRCETSFDGLLSVIVSKDVVAHLYKQRLDWDLGRLPIIEHADGLLDLARMIYIIAVRPDVAERFMGVANTGLLRSAHRDAINGLMNSNITALERNILTNWEVV